MAELQAWAEGKNARDQEGWPAWEAIPGDRNKGLLLLCDHARRAAPPPYGDLGLPPDAWERHIAYDIGAEQVTRRLAELLGAPAVLAGFSRLLIDPNRGEDDPTLVRQLYDGTVIPGNYPLSEAELEQRLARFYRPYHAAVAAEVEAVAQACRAAPFLVSIHSFTARLGKAPLASAPRPWHVGVLWDSDPRAAKPLIDALRADPSLVVGDNEPYDGALRGDTLFRHAIVRGFPHVLVEIRQDLIGHAEGAHAWAERLAPLVDAINRRPDMHEAKRFGSRTGAVEGFS